MVGKRERARRARAVKVLDLVLQFYGPDGDNWLQGAPKDKAGRRCVLNAINHVSRKHRIDRLAAQDFVELAVFAHSGSQSTAHFNDLFCKSFADVRRMIMTARELAVDDDAYNGLQFLMALDDDRELALEDKVQRRAA
jgi:hypothetical protein